MNAHQKKVIQALEELKTICDTNGITMFLLAGTTLGAVRHQGMIPWDDDVDVGFRYNDWIRIKKILPTKLSDDFEYVDYDIEEDFPRLQGKILFDRINCIDIFLLAKWKKSGFSAKFNWLIRDWIVYCYTKKIKYHYPSRPGKKIKLDLQTRIIKKMIILGYKITSPFMNKTDYLKIAKSNEKRYENKKYDCYVNLYSVYGRKKETLNKEWVEKTSKVIFEGKVYDTVGDTDAYLRHLYGDYMVIPPENERIAIHQERF